MRHTIFGEDFSFVAGQARTAVPKLTIPSPSMVHYRAGTAAIDRAVYPDLERFWWDLSTAYADQVRALGELGCRYLQFDDTSLAYLNDPAQRAMMAERGEDADTQHLRYIQHINAAVTTSWPRRSSVSSTWMGSSASSTTSGPEGSSRCGSCRRGKRVVLGLVTTERAELESKDELKRRVEEASKYVPLEQLCRSPPCGFSSTVDGNDLSLDEQQAKLRLVVETAEDIWG